MLRNLSGRPAVSPFLSGSEVSLRTPFQRSFRPRVYSIAGLGFEAREYANGQWPDQEVVGHFEL